MLDVKKRKQKILNYVEKNPLCSFTDIRKNHTRGHEYNTRYLRQIIAELEQQDKLYALNNRYYVIPKNVNNKLTVLVNVIKKAPITRPVFTKLKFKIDNKFSFEDIIINCICLYHLKVKLVLLENKQQKSPKTVGVVKKLVNSNFIKLLKSFSLESNYSLPLITERLSNETPVKPIISLYKFLIFHYTHTNEYYNYLKSNKLPVKVIFERIQNIESDENLESFPPSNSPNMTEEEFNNKILEIQKSSSSSKIKNSNKMKALFSYMGFNVIENPDAIHFKSQNLTGHNLTPDPPLLHYNPTQNRRELVITNKALRHSLNYVITDHGLNNFIFEFDGIVHKSSRPLFLEFALRILFNKGLTKREKLARARKIEKMIHVPITDMII